MPAITLPLDQSAIIKTRAQLSERSVRAISRAFMVAGSTVAKMTQQGFKEDDPNTWAIWNDLTDEDINNVNEYQSVLIIEMVLSWTMGGLPTVENVQDLPSACFQALAAACAVEFNKAPDFSVDEVVDPLVPTGDSPA